MSNPLVMSAWAPGLIGNISLIFAVYEAHKFEKGLHLPARGRISIPFPSLELTVRQIVWRHIGQSIYYARYFPGDSRLIKLMVLVILWVGPLCILSANDAFSSLADSAHMIGSVQIFWDVLIRCHGSSSWICENRLPWGGFITVPLNYAITFAVQSFYGHRVWIISGNQRHLTIAILFTAILQFGLGGWCFFGAFVRFFLIIAKFDNFFFGSLRDGTVEFLYTDPFVLYAAGVSTLCDILITGAVFKYMYNSDLRRRANVIQDLAIVLINMGVLTCLINITHDSTLFNVVVIVTGWGRPALSSVDASYVNSNLAVLNARRSVRQREERRLEHSIELPTLSRII
ncbi:hypothetical protein BU15DRAFT_71025 [Melanogaster broomeanus]|nr:hypothetical protein BU15DRAFT_71025 [Melanogaster broomeanus]